MESHSGRTLRKTELERAARLRGGFTLLEMMAVVMIIGLLMGLIGTQVAAQLDKARVKTTEAKIRQLEGALEMYKMDNARYPSSEQGLRALIEKPSGAPEPKRWQPGGYVKADALEDSWQEQFQYSSPGTNNPRSFDLWSLGSDGTPGGEGNDADLGNWSSESSGG